MNKQKQIEEEVLKIGIKAKEASLKISSLSSQKKNDVLLDAADNIKNNKLIIAHNSIDIEENKKKLNSALLDRLMLDSNRIDSICKGLVEISELDDPIGKILGEWRRTNGLKIQ